MDEMVWEETWGVHSKLTLGVGILGVLQSPMYSGFLP